MAVRSYECSKQLGTKSDAELRRLIVQILNNNGNMKKVHSLEPPAYHPTLDRECTPVMAFCAHLQLQRARPRSINSDRRTFAYMVNRETLLKTTSQMLNLKKESPAPGTRDALLLQNHPSATRPNLHSSRARPAKRLKRTKRTFARVMHEWAFTKSVNF